MVRLDDYLKTISHWEARLTSVGVPKSSISSLVDRLEDWKQWPHLWRELGDAECDYARAQEDAGHQVTAADCWFRAGLYYHFGQFVLFDDEPLRAELNELKLPAFANAFPGMRPPAEHVTIPTDAGDVYGMFRHPPKKENAPLVIVLPGADSGKEEYTGIESLFLERGLSTLSVDGPGQAETRHRGTAWRFDYETAFPAVVAFARERTGTDAIGLMGFSFGGYLAPRVAARCPEIQASVSLGGCYDLSYWPKVPPLIRDDIGYLIGAGSPEEAEELVRAHISLENVLPEIQGALLVVHSTEDRIFPDSDAWRMKERKPDAEVVIYEGGDHCCHNRSHHAKPLIADWLSDRLS